MGLTPHQLDVDAAQRYLLNFIEHFEGSARQAIDHINALRLSGQTPMQIAWAFDRAWDKPRANRRLNIDTVNKWKKNRKLRGNNVPKNGRRETPAPPWAAVLLKLYGQPQKPSLRWCVEELPRHLPAGVVPPSYDAAYRLLRKLGTVERQRGRMLSRQIKALLPFVRRDSSGLSPGDIYTADGHTFDAEVAHPRHGQPFRPEITTVLDVASRKAVGWSAGLAESAWAVMDAQRHAFEKNGVCACWYVDNGSGYKNAAQSDEVIGFAARLGFEISHSLPYNSQARGVIERAHQSIWVRGAKTLPTYIGAAMDAQAKNKVFKLTRRDLKARGTSRLLLPWERFLTWCQEQIDAYNARPHAGLPTINDAVTGKRRHQSPDEAWQQAITQGWQPASVTAEEALELFRPEVVATVQRGELRLFNNLYFSLDLTEFHGEKLRVGYDIHDASRVWVRDMRGCLICVAEFEANKQAYFPQSAIEQGHQKRAAARLKRLDAKREEVEAELQPPALLEHQPANTLSFILPARAMPAQGQAAPTALPAPAPQRPWFKFDPDKYRWLAANPQDWDADDAAWLLDYVAGDEYADLCPRFQAGGLEWTQRLEARARALTDKDFEVAAR